MVDLLSALFKLVDAGIYADRFINNCTSAVASQVLSLRLKPNIRPVNTFLERKKNSTGCATHQPQIFSPQDEYTCTEIPLIKTNHLC